MIFLFSGVAYAMGGKGDFGAGGLAGMVPLLLMFVVFYFLLIRPQQKTAKKLREFIRNLKVGDRVVTTGGLHGEVKGMTDTTITLEIADKVRVKVTRSAVGGSSQEAAASAETKSG